MTGNICCSVLSAAHPKYAAYENEELIKISSLCLDYTQERVGL